MTIEKSGHAGLRPQDQGWNADTVSDANHLFQSHYDELVALARKVRRRRRGRDTFLTGDLLHSTYLKLRNSGPWQSEDHFRRAAVLAMRHVVTDHAKARLAQKRGGDVIRVELDDDVVGPDNVDRLDVVVDLSRLLHELLEEDPRLVRVIDCRFFAGLTEPETAQLLGVTDRTVRRDWHRARAWIEPRLSFAATA